MDILFDVATYVAYELGYESLPATRMMIQSLWDLNPDHEDVLKMPFVIQSWTFPMKAKDLLSFFSNSFMNFGHEILFCPPKLEMHGVSWNGYQPN